VGQVRQLWEGESLCMVVPPLQIGLQPALRFSLGSPRHDMGWRAWPNVSLMECCSAHRPVLCTDSCYTVVAPACGVFLPLYRQSLGRLRTE
jgi:hypothetical protein